MKGYLPMTSEEAKAERKRRLAEEGKEPPDENEGAGMRDTFVRMAKQVYDRRRSVRKRKKLKAGIAKKSSMAMKAAVFLAVSAAAAGTIASVFSTKIPEIAMIVKADEAMTAKARVQAEKVFRAFKENPRKFGVMAERIDDEGRIVCMEILERLSGPDFSSAPVSSPKPDPSLFCVSPKVEGGPKVKFIFRLDTENDELMLEDICLD